MAIKVLAANHLPLRTFLGSIDNGFLSIHSFPGRKPAFSSGHDDSEKKRKSG